MNQEQLVECFQKWHRPIRSWLRNRASIPTSEVDDLAQEVFVRLLRYSQDTVIDNTQGYVFRVAANVANEWRDRARICKPHDAEWLETLLVEDTEQPEALACRDEKLRRVNITIDSLPNRQGVILLMHINDQLTYKQIAAELGLTYRIVLRDLTRAYTFMRSNLFDEVD